jgi:threonine synthase
MAATASDLVIYEGVYDDLIGLWDRLAEDRVFFDCGASRNAYKHEGKKTIAYEIAEQMQWQTPDVLVAPVAVGETFIAAHRGFVEMERLGFIPRRPLMVAAQAARANAVTRAWRDKRAIEPLKIGYTVAEGLAAGNPGRKGQWVLRILNETGGVAGEAEDEEILEAQSLARTEGIRA